MSQQRWDMVDQLLIEPTEVITIDLMIFSFFYDLNLDLKTGVPLNKN